MNALSKTDFPITIQENTISLQSELSASFSKEERLFEIYSEKSGHMMNGMCKIDDGLESLFALFRGLSEAGRPQGLSLEFSFKTHEVTFSYPISNSLVVIKYFKRLISILQREVKFKKVLNRIISIRNHFNAEQRLLQNSLLEV
jgi:hypothetical protein